MKCAALPISMSHSLAVLLSAKLMQNFMYKLILKYNLSLKTKCYLLCSAVCIFCLQSAGLQATENVLLAVSWTASCCASVHVVCWTAGHCEFLHAVCLTVACCIFCLQSAGLQTVVFSAGTLLLFLRCYYLLFCCYFCWFQGSVCWVASYRH